jgi:hypothetical protein
MSAGAGGYLIVQPTHPYAGFVVGLGHRNAMHRRDVHRGRHRGGRSLLSVRLWREGTRKTVDDGLGLRVLLPPATLACEKNKRLQSVSHTS